MKKQKIVCPICDGQVNIPENIEVSEVIICSDCHSRLVVEKIDKGKVVIGQAPEVEEDWGE